MRRVLVLFSVLVCMALAAPANAHPSWTEYKQQRLKQLDAPKLQVLLDDSADALTPLILDVVDERTQVVRRARARWERIDARYARRVAAQAEVKSAPAPVPVVSGDVASIISSVFGSYAAQAVAVATCESGLNPAAVNGQYLGIFQMGESERATYGHASDAYTQARAAYAYFVASGSDWSPWACKP